MEPSDIRNASARDAQSVPGFLILPTQMPKWLRIRGVPREHPTKTKSEKTAGFDPDHPHTDTERSSQQGMKGE